MGVVSRRSGMTLFSSATDHYSHRLRIILAEKGITVDIEMVERHDLPAELKELNPYETLPTLIDRDLTIYQTNVMMEYLDERFPHPPLLPVYPVARAEIRQFIYRVEQDWMPLVDEILADGKGVAKAQLALKESLLAVAPIFAEKPYFMSDEFTLVDCCLAPIFWRLPSLGIDLPKTRQGSSLNDYMRRVFTRPSFSESLTDKEKEIRPISLAVSTA